MKKGISYTQAFGTLLKRDLQIAVRHRGDIFNPLLFFVLVVTLFPLGIGPEPQVLTRVAPGIIWVAALLASMLSLERLLDINRCTFNFSGAFISSSVTPRH